MYRFKTKREFEIEFGPDWRELVAAQWNSAGRMDHLFGWTPESENDQMKIAGLVKGKCSNAWGMIFPDKSKDSGWTFSFDMFTTAADSFTPQHKVKEVKINFAGDITFTTDDVLRLSKIRRQKISQCIRID